MAGDQTGCLGRSRCGHAYAFEEIDVNDRPGQITGGSDLSQLGGIASLAGRSEDDQWNAFEARTGQQRPG